VSSEADRIIALLDLKPHPEGGYFRETFRDEGAHKGRAHSTAILDLLRAGEVSRWQELLMQILDDLERMLAFSIRVHHDDTTLPD